MRKKTKENTESLLLFSSKSNIYVLKCITKLNNYFKKNYEGL